MKKRVLSLFLAITLCLTLTPTGALAAEGQPPEQMVTATQEAQIPAPALEEKEEEKTTPAQTGAGENASPASPDEKPTENTPAAPEKNPADEEPGKEAGQNEPTAEGKNEPLALGLDDPGQNAAEGENGEGSGGTHYVAESGGTHYETVQKILEECEGEITLLDSVKEDLTVYAPTTINMNGHSITGSIYATDSLTLNGGTVKGNVEVDGDTFTMTAPANAAAAIDGELNVISGSAYVSGAKIGVKGTLVFGGTDMTITGTKRAVALNKAAEPNGVKLYGSTDVNGETSDEAVFNEEQSTYTVSGEAAKKLSTTQVNGEPEPEKPTLTINPTSANANAGETATFTATYTDTDTLNAYVQGSAVNGYFTISQKNNGDGTYTVSVKIDEETPGGTYTLFVHELRNTSVQASATITVTGLPDAAEVNGKQYKSLPRALAAAQNGDTVKLLADHVTDTDALKALGEDFTFEQYASIVPVVTKTLTLDLNHKTVDYLDVGFTETDDETQKKETLATGNLTVTGEGAYGRISNLMFMAGALDIRSGEIGGSEGAGLVCDVNSGTATISNGMVYGLTVLEGASVTVNGGSKHAGEWVVASGATLNITDGTFGEVQFTRNGTIAISGGTFKSIKSYIAEELQPLMSLLDTQKVHAFYKGNDVQDGNATELADVTVKEHTHTMVNNKCACGFSCTHTNTEGASTIDKDGKCTACGTQFAAGIGETYYTDVPSALDAATDGQTVKLLANAMLPDGIYVSKTLTLDLNGHSLSGYSLNVGGLTPTGQVRTGNLTVIDSSGGNGAVGVTVRDGGTLVFDPKNDHTTLLRLEVWGGTVELYGGKILRSGLRLNNNITLGDLLPQKAGLAYYRGDTQLTLAEAAFQSCDLVVKSCSHGGKNGFDKSATACPYCGAPAVAETALNGSEGSRQQRRFADLQTALDADRDGGSTLKLLADVTGDYTIDGTKDTGIDLNGYSINGTVDVKAVAEGTNNTTTFSNSKDTGSIKTVVAHRGANLAGSGAPAVIGTLEIADTTMWKNLLKEPDRVGFKVRNEDSTHKWYAASECKEAALYNVTIESLPITFKTLYLKVNGKNLTGNSPKVERGTTVQLCASCNTNGATVEFSILKKGETTPITLTKPSYADRKYTKDYSFDTIGEYTIYFTATKDGYTVQSAEKKLTVTKPNLSNAEITFPYGNVAAFNYATATGVPTFVVTYKGTELKENVDFVITRGASTYDVGSCTLTIKATDNGDYTGSKSAQWNVRPLKVAASVGDIIKTYDGTTDLPANAKITFKSADSYYTGTTLRLAKGTDYEVSNACYDSPDAGQKKTVSFTIKLKNEGYVFEDGTTQKDFTLNGAELGNKIQINKATAPMNNPTGTLNVINGTQQTYTYDFNNILPGLPGGKYGTISYGQADISLVSQSGYYYDETIVEFKKGKLILAQFYAKDGKMTGKIGTVKVNVTTTNYADFQLKLVLYAVDQIKPEPDGTITASEITYGDTLSKSKISGKMKDPNTGDAVSGTFAWTDGTITPNAGGYEADWTFTPDASEYATVTGTVTIKVNKATPTFTAPTAQENLTYTGQEQPLIIAGSVTSGGTMQYMTENGTYSQDIPTGTDAGAYTVWYRVIGDANHNDTAPASVAVRIGKKPLTITGVTAASKPYDGTTNADISGVTFDNVNLNRGTDYTVTANFDDAGVGNDKHITATVTLMEQAAKNYFLEQSSFPATGSITAKQVTVSGITANDKVYDGTTNATLDCSNAKFGGVLENDKLTVAAKGVFEKAEAGKQNVTISDLKLGGNSAANYVLAGSGNQAQTTATITAKKITVSITPNGGSYGGTITPATATANDVVGEDAPEITLTYTGTANDGTEYTGTTPPTKAGTYTVTATTTNPNYTLDPKTTTADFTIAKRPATVTPDNKSKVYEEKDPELTYIVSGVLSGETLKGITLARAEGENAGQYAITATADAGANPNYEVTFAKGTLTIEPKSIKGAKVVLGKGLTANGAEQTQTVEKVLLDDKEIPADSYTVAGNTATAPGRYTLTVTAKGNYTDSVEQIYAIAYKDTAVPSSSKPGSNNSSNNSETKKNEVAAPTPAPTPASTSKPSTITAMPQTGDTSNPTLYVVLLVASLLGLAVVFACKKRNDK